MYCVCNFEITLNIRPPFVMAVAVLIINIHKSRAVTLYLIKHCILLKGDFIYIKSLHVMYYRPFDRPMGL